MPSLSFNDIKSSGTLYSEHEWQKLHSAVSCPTPHDSPDPSKDSQLILLYHIEQLTPELRQMGAQGGDSPKTHPLIRPTLFLGHFMMCH